MNTEQQLDHKTWKQNPDKPLPESLENVLINDCLEELKKDSQTLKNVNEKLYPIIFYPNDKNYIVTRSKALTFYSPGLYDHEKIYIIQALLSRTPDGQAVMPFLDVETEGDEKTDLEWIKNNVMDVNHNDIDNALYSAFDMGLGCKQKTTLDHLLYREFTEALRVGKTLDEALATINLIYLQNI